MELRHVRYFVAVARELSFTKAAALVRVAQPSVSRQIQDLEEELGVALLERGPRGVSLTPEGDTFFKEAVMLLQHADALVDTVRGRAPTIPPASTTRGEIPRGWFPAGSHPDEYYMGFDSTTSRKGQAVVRIQLRVPTPSGFGTLMQQIDASNFRGKRIEFSGEIRSEEAMSGGLWMRVDREERMVAFDNMEPRGWIPATRDWQRYSVVLDVHPEATVISFGLLLASGCLRMTALALDVVSENVPVTSSNKCLPKTPVNLALQDDRPQTASDSSAQPTAPAGDLQNGSTRRKSGECPEGTP